MNPPMRESCKCKKHWYEWCTKYLCTWHCTDDVVGGTVPRANFRPAILVQSSEKFLDRKIYTKMSLSKLVARLKMDKEYKKTVLKVPDCSGVGKDERTQQMINCK